MAYPADGVDATGAATAAETRDGELAMPGEDATRNDDPTRAWDPETDAAFEGADDPVMPPVEAPPAQPVAPHEPEPGAEDESSWEEPSYEAPPAVPVAPELELPPEPPLRLSESPDSGFEELDLPAPSGLVEEPLDASDASEELFPDPPVRPELSDDEDMLDGLRPPARPDSTLEWDPFTDGPGGETRH